jgi:hypothetical protein
MFAPLCRERSHERRQVVPPGRRSTRQGLQDAAIAQVRPPYCLLLDPRPLGVQDPTPKRPTFGRPPAPMAREATLAATTRCPRPEFGYLSTSRIGCTSSSNWNFHGSISSTLLHIRKQIPRLFKRRCVFDFPPRLSRRGDVPVSLGALPTALSPVDFDAPLAYNLSERAPNFVSLVCSTQPPEKVKADCSMVR